VATEQVIVSFRADGTREVQRGIEGIGRSAKEAHGLVGFLKGALLALVSEELIRHVVEMTDAFTTMQNRLKVVTRDTAELAEITDQLFEVSKETRTSIEENAITFQKLSVNTEGLGLSTRDVIELLRTMNEAVRDSGLSASQASGAVQAFVGGLAKGSVNTRNLVFVLKELPIVADAIGKELGVSRHELQDLAEQGKVTADVVVRAMQKASGNIHALFGELEPTIGETVGQLTEAIFKLFSAITSNGQAVIQILMAITDLLEQAAQGYKDFGRARVERPVAENSILQLLPKQLGQNLQNSVDLLLAPFLEGQQRLAAEMEGAAHDAALLQLQQQRLAGGATASEAARGFDKGKEPGGNRLLEERKFAISKVTDEFNIQAEHESAILLRSTRDREVLSKVFEVENQLRQKNVDLNSAEAQAALAEVEATARQNQVLGVRQELLDKLSGPEEARIQREEILADLVDDLTLSESQANQIRLQSLTPAEELTNNLKREVELAKLSTIEAERRRAAFEAQDAVIKSGIDIESDRAKAILASADATVKDVQLQREKQSILQGLRTSTEQLALHQRAVNQLYAEGRIDAEELRLEQNKLTAENYRAAGALGELAAAFLVIDTSARALVQGIGSDLVQAVDAAAGALADFAISGFRDVEALKAALSSLLKDLAKQIVQLIIKFIILRTIQAALSGLASSGGATGSEVGNEEGLTGANFVQHQGGGPAERGRPLVVGEHGRELFVPPSQGNIVPNNQLSEGSVVHVQVVNVQDPDEIPSALNTPGGQKAILNVLGKNRESVRAIVGAA